MSPQSKGAERPAVRGRTASLIIALGLGLSRLLAAAAPADNVFLNVVANARFFTATSAIPSVSVRLRQPAQVDLLLFDSEGRLRRHQAAAPTDATRAEFALTNLPVVPKGTHFFWLVATDAAGRRLGVYPAAPGGGEIFQVRDSQVDEAKQRITYLLPRAGCVRVRAGFREGPYLHPIVSAMVKPAGRHEVPWDGTGQRGLFQNLYQHPALQVNILAVSLPVNLLVDQTPGTTGAPPALVELPARLSDWRDGLPSGSKGSAPPFRIQEDYDLSLGVKVDPATRVAEVKVDCASGQRARLMQRRFELMLFLDAAFLVEDERSQLPFSYRLSTRGLAPGRHVLTVNTIDPDGNVGTRSVEFEVAKPTESL